MAEWKRQQGYAVQESAAHSNLLGFKKPPRTGIKLVAYCLHHAGFKSPPHPPKRPFVGVVALSTSIINPPRPLRKCGNTRHLVKGSDEQLIRGSSILPSRTSEVRKSAWLVSVTTGNSYKFTVGRDTPKPIRSGRLCKTPLRCDGQRTENPQALAVGSVTNTDIR